MSDASQPLANAFADLKADIEQLDRAEWRHAGGLLQRVVAHFEEGTTLGHFVAGHLPNVDFADWFDKAKATMTAVVGSGRLTWPHDRTERVAMQLATLREVAANADHGIIMFGHYFFSGNFPESTSAFVHQIVVPFYEDLVRLASPTLKAETPTEAVEPPAPRRTGEPAPFIALDRIEELRDLPRGKYDHRKLIRLCEELNVAWQHRCFLTVGMLIRTVINHVPPVFGFQTFTQVANNYAAGKSKKELLERLDRLARKLADDYLHATIEETETLPTDRQVDLSVEIDMLLGEVVRVGSSRDPNSNAT